MYNSIKRYYDKGFYTNEQVEVFVTAKWITADEFKEITGVEFPTPQ